MLDLEDFQSVINIVDKCKGDGMFVIPIGITNYKKYYSLLELEDVDTFDRYMKVIFACDNCISDKYSFPIKRLSQFEVLSRYPNDVPSDRLEKNGFPITYYIFQSDNIDDNTDDIINQQINEYFDMISDFVYQSCQNKRRQLIAKNIEAGMYISE